MFTKPLNEETLWKSQMYKAGHISLSIRNPPLNPVKTQAPCSRRYIDFQKSSKKYRVNDLASSYDEYSKKYWNDVKYRQAIYQYNRRLELIQS